MSTRYTTLAVSDLPYPHGLGKSEYEELEDDMRRLLGGKHDDPDENAKMFWTPQYQALIRTHLKPHFDRYGDVIEVAHAAVAAGRTSVVFDQALPVVGSAAYWEYRVGIPAWSDNHPNSFAREVARWTHHPPELHSDGAGLVFDDGRHRISLLRSMIEQSDPDFPVLVRITHS